MEKKEQNVKDLPYVALHSDMLTESKKHYSRLVCPKILRGHWALQTILRQKKYAYLQVLVKQSVLFQINPMLLVGCLVVFRLNGPLRQYFSLYRAVSQSEGERKEKS